MDPINLYTLVVILVLNLVLLWWVFEHATGSENRESVMWSHGLWTAAWFSWFLSWVALWLFKGNVVPTVILADIGSILLIGSSIAYMGGWESLRKYAPVPFVVFVIFDVVWPSTVIFSTHWPKTSQEMTTFVNTVLFAPSLCLAVFSIGFVAWSLLHLSGNWDLTVSMLFLAAGYALFQVVIYQASLFTPEMHKPQAWSQFLLVWRAAFVVFYWFTVLASVGVGFPLRRVLSKTAWLGPVIATALLRHVW